MSDAATYRIRSRTFGFPEFKATYTQALERLEKERRLHRGTTLTLEVWVNECAASEQENGHYSNAHWRLVAVNGK